MLKFIPCSSGWYLGDTYIHPLLLRLISGDIYIYPLSIWLISGGYLHSFPTLTGVDICGNNYIHSCPWGWYLGDTTFIPYPHWSLISMGILAFITCPWDWYLRDTYIYHLSLRLISRGYWGYINYNVIPCPWVWYLWDTYSHPLPWSLISLGYLQSSPAFFESIEVLIISSQEGELVGLRDVWVTAPCWLSSDFFFLHTNIIPIIDKPLYS